jgi:hypothetical protein
MAGVLSAQGMEVSVEDVGEMAFECAAGFSWSLAFDRFAGEEGFGVGVVSLWTMAMR